ncbi:hypothetical protein MSAN_00475900 [Mycena sanguinolenta]|uniref:Uncharacterized protein n=1 Tax=Mycena sanguinolenta TaxID=230812 RepID=A0A8H6Z9C0_9AGAR|nr:hypothetical protein MSAN_00475900 [Mycena sanguinolenta]
MKLSIAATLTTLASLAVPTTLAQCTPAQIAIVPTTLAGMTATQIVAAIDLISNISQNSDRVLSPLSTSTDAATVSSQSQTLVNNFNTIISTIVAALDNLVVVDQAFCATVIGKHLIFAQFQVTAPIAAVLRSLEAALDSFAFALIDVVPEQALRATERLLGSISSDQAALDTAVGNTVTTYNEACVPSPLYPIMLPVCSSATDYAASRCLPQSPPHTRSAIPQLALGLSSAPLPQQPPAPVPPAAPSHALPLRLGQPTPAPLHTVAAENSDEQRTGDVDSECATGCQLFIIPTYNILLTGLND